MVVFGSDLQKACFLVKVKRDDKKKIKLDKIVEKFIMRAIIKKIGI